MELGFRAFFLKKKFYLQLRLIEVYSGVFNGTQVASFFSFFLFLSLIASYSIFYKSSFTMKLDFEKIELQKRGISLISLENGAKR